MLRIEPHTADDPTCIALELPQVLAAVETNLATILSFHCLSSCRWTRWRAHMQLWDC